MLRVFVIATLTVIVQPQLCPIQQHAQTSLHATRFQSDMKRLQDVKLQLRSVSEDPPTVDKLQYKKEESVYIQVLALNSGSQPVFLLYSRLLVQFLPELSRGNEVISYSREMKKRVEDSKKMEARWHDPNTLRLDSITSVKLFPNQLTQASLLALSSYYPKLEPGVYTLRMRYREPNDAEILSDYVVFEIVE